MAVVCADLPELVIHAVHIGSDYNVCAGKGAQNQRRDVYDGSEDISLLVELDCSPDHSSPYYKSGIDLNLTLHCDHRTNRSDTSFYFDLVIWNFDDWYFSSN